MKLIFWHTKSVLLFCVFTLVNIHICFCQKYKLELRDTLIGITPYKVGQFQNLEFQINRTKLEQSNNKNAVGFSVTRLGSTSPLDIKNSRLEYRINDPIRMGYRPIRVDKIEDAGRSMSISLIKESEATPFGYRQGEVLDELNLKTMDNLKFKNKVDTATYYLYNFWGTWCSPCLKYIPKIREFSKTERAKSFRIVSIAKDFETQNVQQTIFDLKMTWTNIYEPFSEKEGVVKKLNIAEYPTIIITDNKGLILYRGSEFNEFETFVDGLK
jgi:thiol-disulfide isomerase/thioredoxin